MDLMKAGASVLGSIGGIAGSAASAATPAAGAANFGDVLKGMVSQTVEAQKQAESMTIAAAQGDSVALQDVVQAISKAELTLQTLVTVRDKAVEAYQEIMRMPV